MTDAHYGDELVTLYAGDCLDVLRGLPDAAVDAVVTDPPYGLGFMGHQWDQPGEHGALRGNGRPAAANREAAYDHQTSTLREGAMAVGRYDQSRPANARFGEWCEAWCRECLRVLKPGGHIVTFGGSRTWHRLAVAVEDAGFELRDSIAWLYGSGFPKSHNIGNGRGTALKPAFEPIVLGRKPLSGTVAATVLAHGTGALNIDACRIGSESTTRVKRGGPNDFPHEDDAWTPTAVTVGSDLGRWPANVALDESQAVVLDKQSGTLTSGANPTRRGSDKFRDTYGDFSGQAECEPARGVDVGGASRFFYTAKADGNERPRVDGIAHPTVKPLSLMRWLVRLVTPPGGIVLEPFAGSGTTVEACILEGFRCIAIEREADYLPLILERIAHPQLSPMLKAARSSTRAARATAGSDDAGLLGLMDGLA